MKTKLIAMMACTCLMVCIAGCGKKSSSGSGGGNSSDSGGGISSQTPGDVVLDFMKTLQAGKFDEEQWKGYVTEASVKKVAQILAKEDRDKVEQEIERGFDGAKFKITDTEINGDVAAVTVELRVRKNQHADALNQFTLPLQKIGGKWKIDLKKPLEYFEREVARKVAAVTAALSEEEENEKSEKIDENSIRKLGE